MKPSVGRKAHRIVKDRARNPPSAPRSPAAEASPNDRFVTFTWTEPEGEGADY